MPPDNQNTSLDTMSPERRLSVAAQVGRASVRTVRSAPFWGTLFVLSILGIVLAVMSGAFDRQVNILVERPVLQTVEVEKTVLQTVEVEVPFEVQKMVEVEVPATVIVERIVEIEKVVEVPVTVEVEKIVVQTVAVDNQSDEELPASPIADADEYAPNVDKSRLPAIDVGSIHSCELRTDGTPVCWGDNRYGQSKPPTNEKFIAISAGGRNLMHSGHISYITGHTCGLRADGSAVCWGDDRAAQSDPPPDEQFAAISAGGLHTCALREDGSPLCWGANTKGQSSPPAGTLFASISAGWEHTCALTHDGNPVCWGDDSNGQATPVVLRSGHYTAISSGWLSTCALRNDGVVICWHRNKSFELLEGQFREISAGATNVCGILIDGRPRCAGLPITYNNTDLKFQSSFRGAHERTDVVAISVGADHVCAMKPDGIPICWGSPYEGQTDVPP